LVHINQAIRTWDTNVIFYFLKITKFPLAPTGVGFQKVKPKPIWFYFIHWIWPRLGLGNWYEVNWFFSNHSLWASHFPFELGTKQGERNHFHLVVIWNPKQGFVVVPGSFKARLWELGFFQAGKFMVPFRNLGPNPKGLGGFGSHFGNRKTLAPPLKIFGFHFPLETIYTFLEI